MTKSRAYFSNVHVNVFSVDLNLSYESYNHHPMILNNITKYIENSIIISRQEKLLYIVYTYTLYYFGHEDQQIFGLML